MEIIIRAALDFSRSAKTEIHYRTTHRGISIIDARFALYSNLFKTTPSEYLKIARPVFFDRCYGAYTLSLRLFKENLNG